MPDIKFGLNVMSGRHQILRVSDEDFAVFTSLPEKKAKSWITEKRRSAGLTYPNIWIVRWDK